MVGDSNIVSSNSARNIGVIFDKCIKLTLKGLWVNKRHYACENPKPFLIQ